MNLNLRSFLSTLIFFFLAFSLQGQKYSNEFLSIGVGANALALGNAVVANTSDVTSGYWNPAGLAGISSDEGLLLGAMHSEWFAGITKMDYLGFSLPMAQTNRRLGFSIIRFGVDGIPNTLSLYNSDGTVNFDNVTQFSAADYAFLFSYAQKIKVKKGNLQMGANLKIIHRKIGPFANSWGFGLDFGAQYQINKWQFGLMASDVTSTFNAWTFSFTDDEIAVLELTGGEVPIKSVEITKPHITLGVSRTFMIKEVTLRPEVDFFITTDGKRNTLVSANPFSIDLAVGLEAGYNDFLFLRAGATQFQKEKNFDDTETLILRPSLGVGLKLGKLMIDYAYTNPSDGQNRYSHIVSLQYNIKPRVVDN
jgi:hypothetical protein